MNVKRRKALKEIMEQAEELRTLLEMIREEEEDAYENMIGDSKREKAETAISCMEDAESSFDEIISSLEEAME